MVAALWSNPSYDDDHGTRAKAIGDINTAHENALEAIDKALSTKRVQEEEKLEKDNPFFQAAERGLQKIEKAYPDLANKKPAEAIDYMKGLDQA